MELKEILSNDLPTGFYFDLTNEQYFSCLNKDKERILYFGGGEKIDKGCTGYQVST